MDQANWVVTIAGLPHASFQMFPIGMNPFAYVPEVIVEIAALYPLIPTAAEQSMQLACKKGLKIINPHRKGLG